MSNLSKFLENKEDLKIGIMDYDEGDIDIPYFSEKYYYTHRHIFLSEKENKKKETISDVLFRERLYDYLWTPKISELIIILYLEDLNNSNPTIYELNRFLRRTSKQYSSTHKAVNKLEDLNIVYTNSVKGAERNNKQVFINKEITKIYGDDEFRKLMLENWDKDAKIYTQKKLDNHIIQKEKIKKRIKLIKKGRRMKEDD